jgi:hypothetical protein
MLGVIPTASGGSSASGTLSVEVVGSGNLSYAWYKSNALSAGATLVAELSGPTVQVPVLDDPAWYSVTVTAGTQVSAGSITTGTTTTVTSARVPVQLLQTVSIVSHPVATTVTAGGGLVLSGSASGGGPISYQWERIRGGRPVAISGATSPILKLDQVRLSDAGAYQLRASNARNSDVSDEAEVTVGEADVIVVQPDREKRVGQGEDVVLRVVASGKELSYQWRKNGAPIPGAIDAPSYTVASLQSPSSATYSVVVSNGVVPDATSRAALLIVGTADNSNSAAQLKVHTPITP